jgi:ABC-type multidrug transport system ATPase subunit
MKFDPPKRMECSVCIIIGKPIARALSTDVRSTYPNRTRSNHLGDTSGCPRACPELLEGSGPSDPGFHNLQRRLQTLSHALLTSHLPLLTYHYFPPQLPRVTAITTPPTPTASILAMSRMIDIEPISAAAPATEAAAVSLTRVSRLYGNFAALRDVSLSIAPGSSVVLLGENGAGKSTLLKLVSGLQAPSFGTVAVFGKVPGEQRGRIATMSHASMLYDELTGLENLAFFARLHFAGMPQPEVLARAAAAMTAVGLDPAIPRRVGEYSQGMRQRASLARVLITEPELLLLDEPFSNLDVGSAHAMIDRLLQYVAEPSSNGAQRTLILTTHQAELARPLARTTITLREGRIANRIEREQAAQ